MRSSKAKGDWSFLKGKNRSLVETILRRFSVQYGVRMLSFANVGNHLHLQIQLSNRHSYRPFIKAVTGAIAMAVTGVNRWNRVPGEKLKFWDLRPYTRVIFGYRGVFGIRDYIAINRLEGMGVARASAELLVRGGRGSKRKSGLKSTA